MRLLLFATTLTGLLPVSAQHPVPSSGPAELLEEVIVTGKAEDLTGIATSASSGRTGNEDLSRRPVLRRGELLEAVPGVIISQHAGGGKANQYFLRGFNLDHGTDFGISVDGIPANMRTHAHGQGYADLNFLVPEFIEGLEYFKGPFFASIGDLSTAGAARYRLYRELPQGIALFSAGEQGYTRMLLGDTWRLPAGSLTLGGEYSIENGPWRIENDFRRINGFARWHSGTEDNHLSITAMAYHGRWHSTDQIPLRAIRDGRIDRFDSPETTDTGESSRYTLSLNLLQTEGSTATSFDLWAGYYDLDLFSNFTYFLNDPVRGDQFEQKEGRWFAGAHIARRWNHGTGDRESHTTAGFETRHDFIDDIGLYLTERRRRFDTVRVDDVYEGSYGLYLEHERRLNPWLRAGAGIRGDLFTFDVDSSLPANSGTRTAGIVSPKAHLVFGPWADTEFHLSGGLGFHSNDARGTTIRIDPATGESADPVDPLVRTWGLETGVRSSWLETVTFTTSLWLLESDSEFVYVGDAGTTEAGPASRRYGVESAVYWRPSSWFTLDGEYAWSHARFRSDAGGGRHIPGAVEHMATAGLTLGGAEGFYGALRARYFGPRPLEESGRVRSKDSLTLNARVGWRKGKWDIAVDCLNLLDRDNNDIEYYYDSRLRGEPAAGIPGVHLHPAEPRQFRVSLSMRW